MTMENNLAEQHVEKCIVCNERAKTICKCQKDFCSRACQVFGRELHVSCFRIRPIANFMTSWRSCLQSLAMFPSLNAIVKVVAFESTNTISLYRVEDTTPLVIEHIQEMINDFGKTAKKIHKMPNRAFMALVRTRRDYHRALVKPKPKTNGARCNSNSKATAYFLDLHIQQTCELQYLYAYPTELDALPNTTYRAKLRTVAKSRISPEMRLELAGLTRLEYVIKFVNITTDPPIVSLLNRNCNHNSLNSYVRDLMNKMRFARICMRADSSSSDDCSNGLDQYSDTEQQLKLSLICVSHLESQKNSAAPKEQAILNGAEKGVHSSSWCAETPPLIAATQTEHTNNVKYCSTPLSGNSMAAALSFKLDQHTDVSTDGGESEKSAMPEMQQEQRLPPVTNPPIKFVKFKATDIRGVYFTTNTSDLERGLVSCAPLKYYDAEKRTLIIQTLKASLEFTDPVYYKPILNEYVMALHDGVWCRGIVKSMTKSKATMHEVYLFDVALTCTLTKKHLRRFPAGVQPDCITEICKIDGLPNPLTAEHIAVLKKRFISGELFESDGIIIDKSDNMPRLKPYPALKF